MRTCMKDEYIVASHTIPPATKLVGRQHLPTNSYYGCGGANTSFADISRIYLFHTSAQVSLYKTKKKKKHTYFTQGIMDNALHHFKTAIKWTEFKCVAPTANLTTQFLNYGGIFMNSYQSFTYYPKCMSLSQQ
jgi:hypothetical protein